MLTDYPYFWGVLAETLVATLALILARSQRRMMLVSGLAATPLSLAALLHWHVYWNPAHLFGGRIGVEDALFCFSLGVMVWLAAAWPVRSRITVNFNFRLFPIRFAGLCLLGGFLFGILLIVGFKIMAANILALFTLAAILLILQRGFWPLPLGGAAIYSCYYAGIICAVSPWLPNFFSMWNGSDLWGWNFLGMPLEEMLWIAGFAACWPLIIARACDIRIQDVAGRKRTSSVFWNLGEKILRLFLTARSKISLPPFAEGADRGKPDR